MNRYLEAGYQFHVSERAGVFTVCELIGKGASCAVYRADFTDEHGNQTQHLPAPTLRWFLDQFPCGTDDIL